MTEGKDSEGAGKAGEAEKSSHFGPKAKQKEGLYRYDKGQWGIFKTVNGENFIGKLAELGDKWALFSPVYLRMVTARGEELKPVENSQHDISNIVSFSPLTEQAVNEYVQNFNPALQYYGQKVIIVSGNATFYGVLVHAKQGEYTLMPGIGKKVGDGEYESYIITDRPLFVKLQGDTIVQPCTQTLEEILEKLRAEETKRKTEKKSDTEKLA